MSGFDHTHSTRSEADFHLLVDTANSSLTAQRPSRQLLWV
jgi:hypothetical protein